MQTSYSIVSVAPNHPPDLAKFKCYRFPSDGSIYYGEVSSIENIQDEETKKLYKMIRHGYGLQIYDGKRNSDGVLTKYEGRWDRDSKTGDNCLAVYKDGSIYTGSFKKDHFEGQGKFEWAVGHIYEGQWKESQMEGNGEFRHANGRIHKGLFRRNYFLSEGGRVFINPIDEEKKQRKNIKYQEEQVLAQKEKIQYEKRMRIYQVRTDEQIKDALVETRSMNRIPLFVRSPKNNLDMMDIIEKITQTFHLAPGPEHIHEINLRKIYSESMGNPIKKSEQREKLNATVKKAILNSQLLFLNFDDFQYPEQVIESQNQFGSDKESDQHHQVFAAGYDPNLKEFSGSKGGLPIQLWNPLEIVKRRELMEQIGLISSEDEIIPELHDNIHFAIWSNLQLKSKVAQKQILDKVISLQQDDLTIPVTSQVIQQAYQFDENQWTETEIQEKIEKRYGKSLPLDCINLIFLLEMK